MPNKIIIFASIIKKLDSYMKCFLGLFSVLLLLFSCGGNKPSEQKNVMREDTTVVKDIPADLPQLSEAEPPVAADGVFDDFAFNFMSNRRFQSERILFPLKYVVDGKETQIEMDKWTFDPLYSKKEIYTMIFDSKKSMKNQKDPDLAHVVVEWIYLTKNRVKQYVFDKTEGRWMMTSLIDEQLKENENSDFLNFYKQFSRDRSYQIKHIQSPFSLILQDPDTYKPISGVGDPVQWQDFAPELPKGVITNINYGQKYTNSKQRLLMVAASDGAMSSIITFKKVRGQWMVTRLENN
ncbi:hypothetical protein HMPREF9332_00357 [Alloprevotella rava F0323]|uniref:DUF4348 domain-containing protein n=2 Tax=Alloprevotella rava TaxID=671218 RepID=G5G9V6_9BACT|nr:hypothetical protein HMPREF9332_00357 [Alloprevotella rava F0323]